MGTSIDKLNVSRLLFKRFIIFRLFQVFREREREREREITNARLACHRTQLDDSQLKQKFFHSLF